MGQAKTDNSVTSQVYTNEKRQFWIDLKESFQVIMCLIFKKNQCTPRSKWIQLFLATISSCKLPYFYEIKIRNMPDIQKILEGE